MEAFSADRDAGCAVHRISPQAEDYHLRYFRNHPDQPYIAGVTKPEADKFPRDFPGPREVGPEIGLLTGRTFVNYRIASMF